MILAAFEMQSVYTFHCRNAIKVENIGRNQVGHIPRDTAAKLAPLMDRREITLEGVMHEGNREWCCYIAF